MRAAGKHPVITFPDCGATVHAQTLSVNPNNPPITGTTTPGGTNVFTFSYSVPTDYATDPAFAAEARMGVDEHSLPACVVVFTQNSFWLVDDAGGNLLGPVAPGTNGSVANRSCRLTNPTFTVSGNPPTLELRLPIVFLQSFTGGKGVGPRWRTPPPRTRWRLEPIP